MSQISGDSECSICQGTEWIARYDDDGRFIAKPCQCREKNMMNRMLKFAELPEAFRDMELNTFSVNAYIQDISKVKIRNACASVKFYLENIEEMLKKGMGLYFYSNTKGSGKTRMVVSIANELMIKFKKQVKFAVSTSIINEIKRTWNDRERTESSLLDALSVVEILIIDDFGTETYADWINDRFYHIINERYMGRKATIFTSNMPLDEQKYDTRITNRIKERTYQIAFPEESVRDTIAQKNHTELLKAIKRV